MARKLQALVLGKPGCRKCEVLKSRLESLLKREEWRDFELAYHDVTSESGIVELCRAECVNPSRLPALLLRAADGEGRWQPIPRPEAGAADAVLGDSSLYQYVGIQTDYSDSGQGVVSAAMLRHVLERARELTQPAEAGRGD